MPELHCRAGSKIILLTASSGGERKNENREREKETVLVYFAGLVPDEHTALVTKGTHPGTDLTTVTRQTQQYAHC